MDCNLTSNIIYSKISILVIEDSKVMNNAIINAFKHYGLKCNSAFTYKEAEKLLKNNSYNYITLDLTLPDAEGAELIENIKELTDAKIIVFTSSKDYSLREHLFQFGILDYLNKDKPLNKNIEDIKKKIKQVEMNKNISILIVDDSSLIRVKLRDILKPRNYNLLFAKTGLEAQNIINSESIDLVILDLELPDIHGLKILESTIKLRENISVIILSGNSTPENYRDCLDAGASDFIKKPFIAEELLLKTDTCIKDKLKTHELNCSNQLLEQYRKTVDIGSIVSKTDAKGIITFVNEQFENISGYTKEELIGKPHNIIRHKDMPSETFKELWETISIKKKAWQGKIKNTKKNGETYYVNTVVNPIFNLKGEVIEYIAIRSDITDIEKTKKYFKEQYSITSDKYTDIFKLSKLYEDAIDKSNIVIRVSNEMKINYVNEHFCELTGYSKNELVGKDYMFLKHPDISKDEIDNIFNIVKEKGLWKGQLKGLTKNREDIYFISTIVSIKNKKNEITEYLGIRLDITKIISLHNELDETQREIIYKMGEIGETRSKETGNHVKRVAFYSELLGLKAGLSTKEAELLKLASPMHDIGKVAIPDAILNKPGKYNDEEYDIMKKHTLIGHELLNTSDREILKASAIIAHQHHEKWDGSGYPQGLNGEEIHIFGRITAIADVFDALGSDRIYKKAWSLDKIFNLFREEKGKHFDPRLIDLFFDNLNDFLEIREKFKD